MPEDEIKKLASFSKIINRHSFNTLNEASIPWTKIAFKLRTKSKDDVRNFWYT